MKRNIVIIFCLLSLLLIFDSMHVGHALTLFLLAGVIPGTNVAISGNDMLTIFAVTAGFTFSRISSFFIRQWAQYSQPKAEVLVK